MTQGWVFDLSAEPEPILLAAVSGSVEGLLNLPFLAVSDLCKFLQLKYRQPLRAP